MSNLEENSPVPSGEEKRREFSSFLLFIRENSPKFPWIREYSSPFSPRRNGHITSFSLFFLFLFVVDREISFSGGKNEGERGSKLGETQEKKENRPHTNVD